MDLIERTDVFDLVDSGKLIGNLNYKMVRKLIEDLPSVNPEDRVDKWCIDCKEYDHDKHCCPRFNKVIRQTLDVIISKGE